MELITLDYIEEIQLDASNPLFSNFHAIDYLSYGLFRIAMYIRIQELKLVGPNTPTSFLSFTPDPELLFITCNFHWFSISLVNYLRLIGLVDISTKNNFSINDLKGREVKRIIKNHCDEYVEKVIPNILKWRNKYSAHFAITAPYEEDHIAFLGASAMMPVSYTKPYYYTSVWKPAMLPATHDHIERWALTESYELLKPRLWPQVDIPPIPITQ